MKDKDKENHNKNKKNTEDDALWAYAMRDVTSLTPSKPVSKEILPTKLVKKTAQKPQKQKERNTLSAQSTVPKQTRHDYQIHKKDIQKLKTRKTPIDARLDLHGMSRNGAYDSLKNFIINAYKRNLKCVLIITGKGNAKHGNVPLLEQTHGILKMSVPQWLAEPEFHPYILSYSWAKPKDGGEGALYVILRRNKDK